MHAFSSIYICLCTKCRRRMLPTKRLMKSSCLETRWRQHIKEQLLTRLRAAVVVAGLQDGPQHPAHHWTRAFLGKHQRKGLPWVFVKRASARSSKHTKYNWCSSPTPTRARLLFFLNLYPPFLHKSTKQHTHTHINTLFLSLFQHPPFSLLMWFSISGIPLSLSQTHVQSIRAPCSLDFQTIQKLTTSKHLHRHCPGLCLHSYPGLHLQPPEKYPYYLSLLPSRTHSLKTATRLIYLMRSPSYFSG